MIEKIRALAKRYEDILSYLFFGVLTTAVNWLIYFPCFNWLRLPAAGSNAIAWVGSVIFAYLTNKPFVFKSHDWSAGTVVPEFSKFVGSRLLSGALETGLIFVTVELLAWNGNLMKILVSVLVVVMNFAASKLLVFRK